MVSLPTDEEGSERRLSSVGGDLGSCVATCRLWFASQKATKWYRALEPAFSNKKSLAVIKLLFMEGVKFVFKAEAAQVKRFTAWQWLSKAASMFPLMLLFGSLDIRVAKLNIEGQ